MDNEKSGFWAEDAVKEITKEKKKEYVCEGMWSPSGYCHIGNARPELFTTYTVYLELKKNGYNAKQIFVVDDFDPIDKIPAGIPVQKEKEFIGMPMRTAKSPYEGYTSWADYFEKQITSVLKEFGLEHIKIQSSYENYKSGKMNELIIHALNHSKEIVQIWNKIAGSEKPLDFLPVTMVCEKCGKIAFTEAKEWDGKKITYNCTECGYEGKTEPLNGKAKLHWRVHWVANWIINDVAFETGGKDHFSKGGSVDVGRALIKEVFNKNPPHQVPTEFINLKGAKMSGSIGNVITPKDWLKYASPKTFRYLFLSNRPNHSINFSFADQSFILLNERYERAERIYYGKEKAENEHIEEDLKKAYLLSTIGKPAEKMPLQVPYAIATQISGMINPKENFEEIIGVLQKTKHLPKTITEEEKTKLLKEFERARNWVEDYAPEQKITFAEQINKNEFTAYKEFFKKTLEAIKKEENAEEIQQQIYETAKTLKIALPDAFKACYKALIAKERGPRLGTLILSLGKQKCENRFLELTN
jgi:lysyl-tRNA synthetase class 1